MTHLWTGVALSGVRQTSVARKALALMRKSVVLIGLLCGLFAAGPATRAASKPLIVEHGIYTIHLLLHPIGTEEYTVSESSPSRSVLTTTSTTSDRGMKRTTSSTLEMGAQFAPIILDQSSTGSSDGGSLTEVTGGTASVRVSVRATCARTICCT